MLFHVDVSSKRLLRVVGCRNTIKSLLCMLAIGRRAGEGRCSEVIIARLDMIVTRQALQKDQVEISESPFSYVIVGE